MITNELMNEFVSLTIQKKAMAKNSIARQFPVNEISFEGGSQFQNLMAEITEMKRNPLYSCLCSLFTVYLLEQTGLPYKHVIGEIYHSDLEVRRCLQWF